MKLKYIEVTNQTNWGKFAVGRLDATDLAVQSKLEATLGPEARFSHLIRDRGWGPEHLFIMDLQTGEGAMFRHGGMATADLTKHRIWVCPMFEPFLTWLYQQDVSELDALPGLVEFTEEEAPSALAGYRRPGSQEDLPSRELLARVDKIAANSHFIDVDGMAHDTRAVHG